MKSYRALPRAAVLCSRGNPGKYTPGPLLAEMPSVMFKNLPRKHAREKAAHYYFNIHELARCCFTTNPSTALICLRELCMCH